VEKEQNDLKQPIGSSLNDWSAKSLPPRLPMQGRYCRVEPLDVERHAVALFQAFSNNNTAADWTYLPYGPFERLTDFQQWLEVDCVKDDPLFHAIIDGSTDTAAGLASYLRITPDVGVIEVGHIHFSTLLQKSPLATEAMFLMMRRVFDELGYRRYEWKCDALNKRSRRAAHRLGFTFEGVFRQATIYKKRNRDTAWFAIIDSEWPDLKAAFESWLSQDNFDAEGNQIRRLDELRNNPDS